MSFINRVTSAMESNRQDLLPWLNKKSRAYLENGVTDIHKIKITYDSSELHSFRRCQGSPGGAGEKAESVSAGQFMGCSNN